MWFLNRGRRRADKDKLVQSIAYDQVLKNNDKNQHLIMLYDEANIILFEKPAAKRRVKKL
jgi:hypothetical protein